MISLIIFIILLIIIILVLIPIKIILKCENSEFKMYFSYVFIKFGKNKKRNKETKKEKKKSSKKSKDIIKQIPKYISVLKVIYPLIMLIFKKIKVKKIHVIVKVSSDNAKDCALLYSHVYSICKLIINFFDLKSKVQSLRVKIIPDFVSSSTAYSGEIVLCVSLLDIFSILIYGTFICVKNIKSLRE